MPTNSFFKIANRVVQSSGLTGSDADLIKKELITNMEAQLEDLLTEGISVEQAEERIIKSFGDPSVIGKNFRHNYRWNNKLERAKFLARAAGILSLSLGFYYFTLPVAEMEIRFWGIWGIAGGLMAFIFPRAIKRFPSLKAFSISGFLLLAAGQILPLGLWIQAIFQGFACFSDRLGSCVGYSFIRIIPHGVLLILALGVAMEIWIDTMEKTSLNLNNYKINIKE